jgi:hypothetical protein
MWIGITAACFVLLSKLILPPQLLFLAAALHDPSIQASYIYGDLCVCNRVVMLVTGSGAAGHRVSPARNRHFASCGSLRCSPETLVACCLTSRLQGVSNYDNLLDALKPSGISSPGFTCLLLCAENARTNASEIVASHN